MARKRMVSPDLFTSETVAALPLSARYLWIGVWTYLDDHGRGKDNAALIKAAVWPLDDQMTAKKVASDVDLLVENGSLCRFECCGARILHAPTWTTWQKVSHPTDTKLCPCPSHERESSRIHRMDSGAAREEDWSESGEILRSVVKSSSGQCSEGASRRGVA